MKAQELAQKTGAKLTMPGKLLTEGAEYRPSVAHVVRTAVVPYLGGMNGLVRQVSTAHHSSLRVSTSCNLTRNV